MPEEGEAEASAPVPIVEDTDQEVAPENEEQALALNADGLRFWLHEVLIDNLKLDKQLQLSKTARSMAAEMCRTGKPHVELMQPQQPGPHRQPRAKANRNNNKDARNNNPSNKPNNPRANNQNDGPSNAENNQNNASNNGQNIAQGNEEDNAQDKGQSSTGDAGKNRDKKRKADDAELTHQVEPLNKRQEVEQNEEAVPGDVSPTAWAAAVEASMHEAGTQVAANPQAASQAPAPTSIPGLGQEAAPSVGKPSTEIPTTGKPSTPAPAARTPPANGSLAATPPAAGSPDVVGQATQLPPNDARDATAAGSQPPPDPARSRAQAAGAPNAVGCGTGTKPTPGKGAVAGGEAVAPKVELPSPAVNGVVQPGQSASAVAI